VRAKAIAAIAAATAIAALFAPGAASARGAAARRGPHDRVVTASFTLPGTHGYAIDVSFTNRHKLSIAALPEREKLLEHLFEATATEYRLDAPQPRRSSRIKAPLGRFGSIDLRFKPQESIERSATPLGCKGDKEKVQAGWFVGHLAFRGERGYTRVRSTKAFGTVTNLPAPTKKCHDKTGRTPHERAPDQRARAAMLAMARQSTKPGVHLLALGATKKAGNRRVGFAGIRLSATHKGKEVVIDTFAATVRRDRGRIQEQGTAYALLALGPYFKVPDLTHPTAEGVLAPPKPFLGGATFHRESTDGVSWKGDLRVNLPGFGVVPLTGSKFKVVTCADSGCHLKE
jgi:hypothetical protein